MTLNELKALVDAAVERGHGKLNVAYGDCNGYTDVGSAEYGYIDNPDDYIMEPGSTDTGTPFFLISE